MGLAPLGDPDALKMPPLEVRELAVHIPEAWLHLLDDTESFRYSRESTRLRRAADLAAAGQRCFEDALSRIVSRLKKVTGAPDLCYAGGCALNCSANGRIVKEGVFSTVHIPPAPGDAGSSIGCAIYGAIHGLGIVPSYRWTEHDYLGPALPPVDLGAIGVDMGLEVHRPTDLEDRIADMLVAQNVVGLFHGPCEMGPRALGHRSILADPRQDSMRIRINNHIKGREEYRPLAPAVLEEHAAGFFCVDRPLRFMQYAVAVREDKASQIPAVTHVDGSARIQSVPLHGDPVYRRIIERFFAKTGVPVILNTSFNGKDEPMVETLDDALRCLMSTRLDALVVPPYLVVKKV
jgi:carbamoyltransferase